MPDKELKGEYDQLHFQKVRIYWEIITVILWYPRGTGSRIPPRYQNLKMFKSLNCHSDPQVPTLQIPSTFDRVWLNPMNAKPTNTEGPTAVTVEKISIEFLL